MVDEDSSTLRGGYRTVPHTADLRVEAWGPTREDALVQAVRGAVASVVELDGATGRRLREVIVRGETDEDLLVALLDEVVYRLDAADELPVDVALTPVPGGVRAGFTMTDMAGLPVTGAAPKAVTLHELYVGRALEGWRCTVTLDV